MEAYVKEIVLPSSGRLYNNAIPGGLVSIEPLGTREEKLFSAGINSSGEILNRIFSACLKCPIDHQDLVLGDRMFVLLQLRSISYGNYYEFPFRCSECSKKAFGVVDLDKLTLIPPGDGEDPARFSVQLPVLGNDLVLRLLTGRDEDKIRRYSHQVAAKTHGRDSDSEYTYRLARRVVSIDGSDVGIREAMEFVESLKGKDSLAIRDAIRDHDIGPDLDVEPACSKCGFENGPFSLPFDVEFFRPRGGRPRSDDHLRTAEALDATAPGNMERHSANARVRTGSDLSGLDGDL